MRFTLGKMFLAVAMLALACAGMMYRSPLWTDAVVTTTTVLFVAVAIRAITAKRREWATTVAFSVVGLLSFFIGVCNGSQIIRDALPMKYVIAAVWRAIKNPERQIGHVYMGPASIMDLTTSAGDISRSDQGAFNVVFYCVFSWLFAVLAAWFAGRMYDRRERVMKKAT